MVDFETYHKRNPGIYKLFRQFALEAKRKGFQRYSAKGIFELIRWHTAEGSKTGQYKVDNNYHAEYARKLMLEEPEFRGFFRIRQRPTLRKFKSKNQETNAA